MKRSIIIKVGAVELEAELNSTGTADAIWRALPIQAEASTWGGEIYFEIPVSTGLENGKEVVERGDLGYWPTGSAFCIFFGPTPASRGKEIRPASAVTIFGRVVGDATVLKLVKSGDEVLVKRKMDKTK